VEITTVDAAGAARTIHRTIGTGGSFGAGSLQLHVGLGTATQVRQVRIVWPDRARSASSHLNLSVNQSYRIVQGKEPVLLQRPATPFRKVAGAGAADHHPTP
jgi:hypothetical protein